jgi:hypothetical protein
VFQRVLCEDLDYHRWQIDVVSVYILGYLFVVFKVGPHLSAFYVDVIVYKIQFFFQCGLEYSCLLYASSQQLC